MHKTSKWLWNKRTGRDVQILYARFGKPQSQTNRRLGRDECAIESQFRKKSRVALFRKDTLGPQDSDRDCEIKSRPLFAE
ncbi:hypothetical protein GCM10025858_34810 [Alicyclobacillus sacchari]|nr:hypothetical protein GCM10025858_34810 [Alicyclobacillus sacchari]